MADAETLKKRTLSHHMTNWVHEGLERAGSRPSLHLEPMAAIQHEADTALDSVALGLVGANGPWVPLAQ